MALETTLVTAEEFKSLKFDGPCELIRGEVRPMNPPKPSHGLVCGTISGLLWAWNEKQRLGYLLSNDSGLLTRRNSDSVRGPDVAWISKKRLPDRDSLKDWLQVPPEVCVEVISLNDRWSEITDKLADYLQFGIDEVWIADAELQQLLVYTQDKSPRTLRADDDLTSPALPGFQCQISELFRDF